MTYVRFLLFFFLCPTLSLANTWHIGPSQTYTKPSQIANLVQNGDTILIEAGVYAGDVARWTANNLLFRGIGGKAHLKSGGQVSGGKGIWVISGNDVTVENIEFSEAACPDRNGAGIRSEGINLTLRNCYFHDNENGILAGDIASGDFLIEYCEFSGNGYADGQAHNLYLNHAKSLTFRYNYSHDAHVGHELKSRALSNFIYCNRFSDENGSASRSIDLPNGGFTIIMGNLIVQDPLSENSNLLAYGLEGLNNPNSELYVVYNTFVNNKTSGSFIHVANGVSKLKAWNNIFAGPGTFLNGTVTGLDTLNNLMAPVAAFQFTNPAAYNFQPETGSIATGITTNPGAVGGFSLSPTYEYVHPANSRARTSVNDAGAFDVPGISGVLAPEAPSFMIYPNPARDFLMINGAENASTFAITGTDGKVRIKNSLGGRLDVSDLPAGIYLLNIPGSKTPGIHFIKYF